jgi:hypothetical protein
MGHYDQELSRRFAKSCTTAAFGYARAASAAYAALADQALDFWSTAAKAYNAREPADGRDLRLVTGPRPYRSAVSSAHVVPSTPNEFFELSINWANSPMFAPARAWWGMFPLQGNPASWPMAYAMMTAGVPRAVAMPTAEANIAAMDAAQLATQSIDRAFFPSYRSEGGYAVSPMGPAQSLMTAMFPAPLAAFKFPWAS